VLVLCPQRDLGFGDPEPVEEFLERRVRWIELDPARQPPDAPLLQRALGLLMEPEGRIASTVGELCGQAEGAVLLEVITAIVGTRLKGRSIDELCAMTGLSLEDFRQSVVYREIYGTGEADGIAQGLAEALLDFGGADDLRAWLAQHG